MDRGAVHARARDAGTSAALPELKTCVTRRLAGEFDPRQCGSETSRGTTVQSPNARDSREAVLSRSLLERSHEAISDGLGAPKLVR
jgi:hypothetical protein